MQECCQSICALCSYVHSMVSHICLSIGQPLSLQLSHLPAALKMWRPYNKGRGTCRAFANGLDGIKHTSSSCILPSSLLVSASLLSQGSAFRVLSFMALTVCNISRLDLHSFLLQLDATEAAYQQAAGRLSEAERCLLIAEDQQTVQYRACRDLEEQVAAGQKALTEALGRQAAAERALLLEADAAKVLALKEAERQKVEAEQACERAQKIADKQVAVGAKALRRALNRVNELEKQMPEKGSEVLCQHSTLTAI